jgi:hypothetical protein
MLNLYVYHLGAEVLVAQYMLGFYFVDYFYIAAVMG